MMDIKKKFTKWYVKRGYRFGYDFTDCEIAGDDFFKMPIGIPNAYWICPNWIKPLLILFSPSVYTMLTFGEDFAKGFQEGIAEVKKHGRY